MRELQLWDVDEGVEETFSDVEDLAVDCRFPDCEHDREPGCAVLAAVDEGRLTAERLESYHKIRRELQALALRQDRLNRLFEKKRVKSATKAFNKHVPRR